MGWSTAFGKLCQGDFRGAVDWLYLDEENVAMGERADAGNIAITQQLYSEGLISAEEQQQSIARIESKSIDNMLASPEYSPYVAFQESIAENTSKVLSGTKKGLGTVFGLPFKVLPWQFYVLLVSAVAIYTSPYWFPIVHAMLWGGKRKVV